MTRLLPGTRNAFNLTPQTRQVSPLRGSLYLTGSPKAHALGYVDAAAPRRELPLRGGRPTSGRNKGHWRPSEWWR